MIWTQASWLESGYSNYLALYVCVCVCIYVIQSNIIYWAGIMSPYPFQLIFVSDNGRITINVISVLVIIYIFPHSATFCLITSSDWPIFFYCQPLCFKSLYWRNIKCLWHLRQSKFCVFFRRRKCYFLNFFLPYLYYWGEKKYSLKIIW